MRRSRFTGELWWNWHWTWHGLGQRVESGFGGLAKPSQPRCPREPNTPNRFQIRGPIYITLRLFHKPQILVNQPQEDPGSIPQHYTTTILEIILLSASFHLFFLPFVAIASSPTPAIRMHASIALANHFPVPLPFGTRHDSFFFYYFASVASVLSICLYRLSSFYLLCSVPRVHHRSSSSSLSD